MPFIKQEKRPDLDEWLSKIPRVLDNGDLTYIVYKLMRMTGASNFDEHSDCLKVMLCAMLQYWSDDLHPYEAKKKEDNGDVLGGENA